MDFYDIMLNLLVGISGGIFSSIIVSRIFLISTEFKEQLHRVQERVENTFYLSGFLDVVLAFYKDGSEPNDTINEKIIEITNSECISYRQMIFDDLEEELHALATEYNNFIVNISVSVYVFNESIVIENIKKLNNLTNKFFIYKKSYKKILRRLLLKDKMLRILFVFLLVIIISTILAM